MIFSELYSAYYNTVAKIIKEILFDGVDNKIASKIIKENAFEESVLSILPAIKEERWQVITKDYKTPIKHIPTMPLTTLQKRWLKAILLDERVKLFDIEISGLKDVEPLFTKDDYCIYDKYLDGDDYQNEEYITNFKTILFATRNKLPVKAEMVNRRGNLVSTTFVPQKIEYSQKDDKFRVVGGGSRFDTTLNIARITKCSLSKDSFDSNLKVRMPRRTSFTMMVKDERNALERAMLHFSHFEKRVEKIDSKNYKVTIKYVSDDEAEMVIRVLAFGPLVEVVEPQSFRKLIIKKLKKQLSCEL